MRVAVVGHVEWVRFLQVNRSPTAGAILRAERSWEEPAGGGGVAAIELARLAGQCSLYTALGDDAVGRRIPEILGAQGIDLLCAWRKSPQRQAVTLLDPDAERTIIVIGSCPYPKATDDFAAADFKSFDAVYFCKGDAELLRRARQARVLVATARVLSTIREAGVQVDALVRSQNDPDEAYRPGDLPIEPRLVVSTQGRAGGQWHSHDQSGRWEAAPLPDSPRDAYGAGDCFAAGLSYALAQGLAVEPALRLAAERGAQALCRSGVSPLSHELT